MKHIELIVPCFNEADSAQQLVSSIKQVAARLHLAKRAELSIIIVDDGSKDNTAKAFAAQLRGANIFKEKLVMRFSRNFGKEAAIYAGLAHCSSDACIILDADLQDPPQLIEEMIDQWLKGSMIVNAIRQERTTDGFFKRLTASLFYLVFAKFSHLEIELNASDFRLLDKAVISAILSCPERIRFSKGFFAWVGYEQSNIYYRRPKRHTGNSKWSIWKLWNYALDGIFSFSTSPLRIWSYIGAIVTLLSFIQGSVVVARTILLGVDIPGYASLFTSIAFLGGLQLIGIGIVGEYIGRIYIECKRRPHYVLRSIVNL